jgi:alanine racemase
VLGPMRTYTTSQSWIEVDYGHLADNAATVLQHLPPGAIPLAMVQGNGYGHGLDFAAKVFLDVGFKELGVTDINEAITLRQASASLAGSVKGSAAADLLLS